MRVNRQKRIFYGWLTLAVLMVLLVCRLAWVQFVMKNHKPPGSRHTLLETSMLQRERGIVLDTGRGHFTDRNGLPLTGKLIWSAVLFPIENENDDISDDSLLKLAHILNTEDKHLREVWFALKEPILWHAQGTYIPLALNSSQIEAIKELKLSAIRVLPYEQRYGDRETGMQWLGFISGQRKENLFFRDYEGVKGTSGLERTLDALLQGTGPTVVYFPVDGRNQIIQEMKPMVKAGDNPYYPLRITTTVDAKLQKGIEQLTEQAGMKEGAVVVLDVRNSDVLAMVSRPFYNPEQIHPEQGEWENKALKGAVPGSIFKIVTAAAALDSGLTSSKETFHCNGEFGKYGLSCWKEGGHGTLNLRQGFAESCNVVFAELAERLTSGQIQDTALQLGLGRTVGWQAQRSILGIPLLKPLDHEESGTVFAASTDPLDSGARVQTAIGQRDTLVTPLQAANLVVTLLNDGDVISPRIVHHILYANGQHLQTLEPMKRSSVEGTISRETARTLLTWMEDVVRNGTGRSLKHSTWQLGGKSGTAETMVKGRPRNNQWFVGYGPIKHPRYAVAVLVENVSPHSKHQATKLFGQVMDLLSSFETSEE
ncbi:penicillin-binding protein 2 [Paenibacillus sp. N3/727]|uniref:peptidoglycan D,D-transpeptidase FtsI family protein n=1 Tax=Paenibacillus sp. N3/727 TaxID=2925845 RepID=UPI001F53A637|nr:penicillin-binding protein 2 [Paenibacillus sp. N3/727]UNK19914.1 penicillin-binding protein 2 [Paenibacillus sp. N3/727]